MRDWDLMHEEGATLSTTCNTHCTDHTVPLTGQPHYCTPPSHPSYSRTHTLYTPAQWNGSCVQGMGTRPLLSHVIRTPSSPLPSHVPLSPYSSLAPSRCMYGWVCTAFHCCSPHSNYIAIPCLAEFTGIYLGVSTLQSASLDYTQTTSHIPLSPHTPALDSGEVVSSFQ